MTRLRELLTPDTVRIDVPAEDWRAAVRAAGEPLVATGVCGTSYTDAMIHNVEEHGPYIVIAPGFAFAHSRPDASVTRTGMSAVRLAQPVRFGHDSNDPVTLVVALAAVDSDAHRAALAELARMLGNPTRRAALDQARTPEELLAAFDSAPAAARAAAAPTESSGAAAPVTTATSASDPTRAETPADAVPSKGFILTVCGNGLGTSLFLKNTLEGVLDRWGWGRFMRVEATDTISARGRAKEADVLFTSGAIAQTLGDVGVPVEVIDDFTDPSHIDAALRRVYAI